MQIIVNLFENDVFDETFIVERKENGTPEQFAEEWKAALKAAVPERPVDFVVPRVTTMLAQNGWIFTWPTTVEVSY